MKEEKERKRKSKEESKQKVKEKKNTNVKILIIFVFILITFGIIGTYFIKINKTYTYKKSSFWAEHGEGVSFAKVVSAEEYMEYVKKYSSYDYYTDMESNYVIMCYANGFSNCNIEIKDYKEKKNQIIIYGKEEVYGVMASGTGYFVAIPTKMPVGTKVQYVEKKSLIERIESINESSEAYKPIIYIYPEEEKELTVELEYKDLITCSYPEYKNRWNILAYPNGDLVDLDTGRSLYALYYESTNMRTFEVQEDGFVVKSEDTVQFLEEKLSVLGLNEREAEEFIVYWLPKLQKNKYNYIRFATTEEINSNMPLNFSEEPDTLIRVLMTYKGLNNQIEVEEQKLETPTRDGFVIVEWGGTEIK